MNINKWSFIYICGLLFSIFIFSGCAGPSLYSINMYYDADEAAISINSANTVKNADTANSVISVAEFIDIRKIDDPLVIGHVVETDGMKVLVFPRNVRATKVISNGIKQYLKKSGYKVAEKIEQWNLKADNIPPGDSKVIIGGSIEDLEINCRKGSLTNSYISNIKLNIIFADASKGKILYESNVESSYSRENVLFSENILGEQADIVLADAIEKLFEDKVVAQKLKDALAQ
jgi:uncharacterized lipoprotein YajG